MATAVLIIAGCSVVQRDIDVACCHVCDASNQLPSDVLDMPQQVMSTTGTSNACAPNADTKEETTP